MIREDLAYEQPISRCKVTVDRCTTHFYVIVAGARGDFRHLNPYFPAYDRTLPPVAPANFFTLQSPFPDYPGTVHLLEPPDAPAGWLRQQLLAGTYDKPYLLDDGETRSLLFSLAFVQSSMRLVAPDALDLAYTRLMVAFVLFHTNARELLLLGLGGGSLVKFLRRHQPGIRVTAVEADARVLAFREAFRLPPDDERLQVIVDDAAAVITRPGKSYDVILVDAFDVDGAAPSVSTAAFYQAARARLAARGVLVANLAGELPERRDHLALLRDAFADNVLAVAVEDGCNHVAFAFADPAFEPRWKWIDSQAKAFQARFGIDFPKIASRLERASRTDPLSAIG